MHLSSDTQSLGRPADGPPLFHTSSQCPAGCTKPGQTPPAPCLSLRLEHKGCCSSTTAEQGSRLCVHPTRLCTFAPEARPSAS